MCVAVIVTGASPTLAELQDMEEENPHGAGLAWKEPGDNRVTYRKGLTALQVHEVLDTLPRPVLLHFRWSTAGSRSKQLTHPFPLGYEALFNTALEGRTKSVMIHNGTWREWKQHVPEFAKKWDISDTQIAAYYMKANPRLAHEIRWAVAVGYAKGRDKPMKVSKFGDTWVDHGGNLYSNLNWLWQRRRATQPAVYGGYTGFQSRSAEASWWQRVFNPEPPRPRRTTAPLATIEAPRVQRPADDGINYRRAQDKWEQLTTAQAHRSRLPITEQPKAEEGKPTLLDRLADEDEARRNAEVAFYEEFFMEPEVDVVEATAPRIHAAAQPVWDPVTKTWTDEEGNQFYGTEEAALEDWEMPYTQD